MEAFWDLDSERSHGGTTIGRIPWSKAIHYAKESLGLDRYHCRLFWIVIRVVDSAFLKFQKDEHDRYVRNSKQTATPQPQQASGGQTPYKR